MKREIESKIIEEINKGNHILLKGRHGIGKSYLAQAIVRSRKRMKSELWFYTPFCKPPKQIMLSALEFILPTGKDDENWKLYRRGTIIELSQNISAVLKSQKKKLVLVIDELHTISANASSSYHLLMQHSDNVIFFTTATEQYLENKINKPEMKRFFWELKEIQLPLLIKKESYSLFDEFTDLYQTTATKHMRDQVVKHSKGNALAIRKAVEKISKDEIPEITKHGVIRDDAVNLFPVFILIVFIIVGSKYLFRGSGEYELANISGFFGIILLFAMRFFSSFRRN